MTMLPHIAWTYPHGMPRAVTFSYDDGQKFDRELVAHLNRYGMKCTFNLVSTRVFNAETPGTHVDPSEVRELYRGHEVAVHTVHHPFLERSNPTQTLEEILENRRELEALVGYPVTGMAYPFGSWNEMVHAQAKAAGIHYSRDTDSTHTFVLPQQWLAWHPTCHHSEALPLMEKFRNQTQYPLNLFYIWGHSYEFDRNHNWDLIDQICEELPKDDLTWYATNGEIYDYVEAMRQLVFTADLRHVKNPTATEVWFRQDGQLRSVKPGELLAL